MFRELVLRPCKWFYVFQFCRFGVFFNTEKIVHVKCPWRCPYLRTLIACYLCSWQDNQFMIHQENAVALNCARGLNERGFQISGSVKYPTSLEISLWNPTDLCDLVDFWSLPWCLAPKTSVPSILKAFVHKMTCLPSQALQSWGIGEMTLLGQL